MLVDTDCPHTNTHTPASKPAAPPQDYWKTRHAHREAIHDMAFEAHHYTREVGANVYANTRRVAGLMTAFENDDYQLQVGGCPFQSQALALCE